MGKVELPEGAEVILDPIDGAVLTHESLFERLLSFRQSVGLDDLASGLVLHQFLLAASPREIIARLLDDLKEIHTAHGEWHRLLAVQNRLLVLLPQAWVEYRNRGLLHEALGHTGPTRLVSAGREVIPALGLAEGALRAGLGQIFAVAEAYPSVAPELDEADDDEEDDDAEDVTLR